MDQKTTGTALRSLGKCGIAVSEIGVGCWAIGGPDWNLDLEMGWGDIDEAEAVSALRSAVIDHGANHFDTADVYGHGRSERLIGKALKELPRSSYVLGSKVGYFSGTAIHAFHPQAIRHQLETSLTNLQTDYLDIYYMHNFDFGPQNCYQDDAVDMFHRLRDEGKIRAIGMRGPHRHAIERGSTQTRPEKSDKYADFRKLAKKLDPDIIQLRFNILTAAATNERQAIFDWAVENRVGIVMNKPLAQGLLLGKYDPNYPPEFCAGDHRRKKSWFRADALSVIDRRLQPLKDRFGDRPQDLARVALQYCLAMSQTTCTVVGFSRQSQLTQNMEAIGRPLSSDDVAFIDSHMSGIAEEIGTYFASEAGGSHGPRSL